MLYVSYNKKEENKLSRKRGMHFEHSRQRNQLYKDLDYPNQ